MEITIAGVTDDTESDQSVVPYDLVEVHDLERYKFVLLGETIFPKAY